ncbi:MAG: FAD-binding oxidoreductase [Candidatus Hodarchaeales archaeon]
MKRNTIESTSLEEKHDIGGIKHVSGSKVIHDSYAAYLTDESKTSGIASELFFPLNTTDVMGIFDFYKDKNEIITISGARTGLTGGCVPSNGVIISLEKMKSFTGLRYDQESNNWFIKCQAGVTLKEISDAIKKMDFNLSEEFNQTLDEFKKVKNTLYYPVDPTEMTASVGGTVATNASGSRTYKYGATREWISWIEVVLASGEMLQIPRGTYFAENSEFIIRDKDDQERVISLPAYAFFPEKVKNAAGIYMKENMDLIDLFIGSEGILGVITGVEIRLTSKENRISIAQFFKSDKDALEFVIDLRKHRNDIDTDYLEFMDGKSLDLLRKKQLEDPKFINMPRIPKEADAVVFFDLQDGDSSLETAKAILSEITVAHGSSLHFSWAGYEEREKARFKHFRHALPETVNNIIAERKKEHPALHKLGTDMAVPDEALLEMYEYYIDEITSRGYEYVIFGHIGDNHPHVNILPRDMEELEEAKNILYMKFAEKAVSLGGTVSAEHGIGKIKKKYLKIMFKKDIEKMIEVKKALDPSFILNRGSLFDIEV